MFLTSPLEDCHNAGSVVRRLLDGGTSSDMFKTIDVQASGDRSPPLLLPPLLQAIRLALPRTVLLLKVSQPRLPLPLPHSRLDEMPQQSQVIIQ